MKNEYENGDHDPPLIYLNRNYLKHYVFEIFEFCVGRNTFRMLHGNLKWKKLGQSIFEYICALSNLIYQCLVQLPGQFGILQFQSFIRLF